MEKKRREYWIFRVSFLSFMVLCLVLWGLLIQYVSGLGLGQDPVDKELTGIVSGSSQSPGTGDAAGSMEQERLTGGGSNQEVQSEPAHQETVTLVATGDILMHNTQIWSGEQPDGTYKFDFFGSVQGLIRAGDYASTDFEAALAGPETGYTGYPLFNSPDAMATALHDAGYNLVVTANNHVLDRGVNGALRTVSVLRQAGLDTTGSFRNEKERKSWLIKDIRGIKLGYLAYTYGTNGIPVPGSYPFLVNTLDEQRVLNDIECLRPQVDILILVAHWGEEYRVQPTGEQKRLAKEFLTAGADIILGSHPHVLEPMEVMHIGDRDKFVIYSMGNFIGDQIGTERNSGIVLNIQFTKDFGTGRTSLSRVSYTPTYSQAYIEDGRRKFRVIPVADTITKVERGEDPYLSKEHLPLLQQVLDSTTKILGPGFSLNSEG